MFVPTWENIPFVNLISLLPSPLRSPTEAGNTPNTSPPSAPPGLPSMRSISVGGRDVMSMAPERALPFTT